MLLAVAGCVADEDSDCAPLLPDVPVISARFPASDTVASSDWTELWRVGGQREGQELAIPVSAAASSSGVLAIPDFQLQEVVLIGPDGVWQGPRFQRGHGPEEVMFPVAAVWSSDGKLIIFDIGASKTITLGPDTLVRTTRIAASFVGPVVASGELLWAGVTPSQAVLLHPGWKPVAEVDEDLVRAILRLKNGATHPDTLVTRTLPAVSAAGFGALPAPRWARPLAAVGFNGHIAVGGFDESYRFLIYDSTGSVTRQVCGRSRPLPLTPAEQGILEGEGMESLSAALREAVVPAVPAAYGRLVVDADARIWVQRERPDPVPGYGLLYGQPGATYDVFDSTGQPAMTAKLPARAYLLDAKGGTIWTFEMGDFDEVEVVAYQRSRG